MAFGIATCLLTDGARTVSGTGGILDGSSGAVGAVPGSRWVVAFAGSGLSPVAAGHRAGREGGPLAPVAVHVDN